MSISVVIPAYNEGQVIGSTVDCMYRFLADNYERYQVVIVNDGSRDNTLEELNKIPYATVVSYEDNRGKGFALKKGVEKAWGDFIVLYDADMAYDPGYIKDAERLLKHFDIVAGTRTYDHSGMRGAMSRGFARYVDRSLHLGISDTQCGFKAMRSTAAKKLFPHIQLNGFAFDVELFVLAQKQGYTVAQLPVQPREEVRPSKVHPVSDGISMASDIRKIKRRMERM